MCSAAPQGNGSHQPLLQREYLIQLLPSGTQTELDRTDHKKKQGTKVLFVTKGMKDPPLNPQSSPALQCPPVSLTLRGGGLPGTGWMLCCTLQGMAVCPANSTFSQAAQLSLCGPPSPPQPQAAFLRAAAKETSCIHNTRASLSFLNNLSQKRCASTKSQQQQLCQPQAMGKHSSS